MKAKRNTVALGAAICLFLLLGAGYYLTGQSDAVALEPGQKGGDYADNYALSFNGTDAYVAVLDDNSLEPPESMTLEGWFQFNELGRVQDLVSKNEYTEFNDNSGYYLRLNADNTLSFCVQFDGTNCAATYRTVTTGRWYHVAGTLHIGVGLEIYLEGIREDTTPYMSFVRTNAVNLQFGRDADPTDYGNYFNGSADEIRISASAEYDGDFIPTSFFNPEDDTVGLWHLDEGELTFAYDFSMYENDGELHGATWVTSCETVTAAFSASYSGSVIMHVADFTNQTSGMEPYLQVWEFGDGKTGRQLEASHFYLGPGVISPSLSVIGPGCEDKQTLTDFFTAACPDPTPEFSADPTTGDVPLTVQFTDLTTCHQMPLAFFDGATDLAYVEYDPLFNLGDQWTIEAWAAWAQYVGAYMPVIHKYAGTWSVANYSLAVTDHKKVVFRYHDTTDALIELESNTTFSDGSLEAPQHLAVQRKADGTLEMYINGDLDAQMATTAAQSTGTGVLGIGVTTLNGSAPVNFFGGLIKEVRLSSVARYTDGFAPAIENAADADTVGLWHMNEGTGSVIVDSSSNGNDGIFQANWADAAGCANDTFLWDFGDDDTSTEKNPLYDYTDIGVFDVSFTTTSPQSNPVNETKVDYITVSCGLPEADFTANPLSGAVPLTVNFNDTSTADPNCQITAWHWDFGDGETSEDQNPSHEYLDVDTYTVSLTVTNIVGNDTETKIDYIDAGCPPLEADFSGAVAGDDDDDDDDDDANPEGPAPLTVNFTDQTQTITNCDVTSWEWDFGDGNNDTVQNPTHEYQDVGTFTVSMTAHRDAEMDTETKGTYVTVLCPDPEADFSANKTELLPGETVTFTDDSTFYEGCGINNHSWDFGDGVTEDTTDTAITHNYESTGVYTVSLTVTNEDGSDTETKSGYITVACPLPEVDFTGEPRSGVAPVTVLFENLSGAESGCEITAWLWNFEIGTSEAQDPSITFTAPGSYTVSLRATNDGGSQIETKTDFIVVESRGGDTGRDEDDDDEACGCGMIGSGDRADLSPLALLAAALLVAGAGRARRRR